MPETRFVCAVCGKGFFEPPSQMKGKVNPTCSNKCRYELRRGGRWTPYNKRSSQSLLDDLNSLAFSIGKIPNAQDVNIAWSGRSTLYARRFGSVRKAVIKCGLDKLFPKARISGITSVPFFDYDRADGKTIRLQGSYEVRFASVLDKAGIKWLAHREFPPIDYIDGNGKNRKYYPDFFMPETNIYVETKGWMRDEAAAKMKICMSQNPDKVIVILFSRDICMSESDIASRGLTTDLGTTNSLTTEL